MANNPNQDENRNVTELPDEHPPEPHASAIAEEEKRLLEKAEKLLREQVVHQPSGKLTPEDRARIMLPNQTPFGLRVGEANDYRVLPSSVKDRADDPSLLCWRIELYGLGDHRRPLGLDICGDAVLGRGNDANALPDLDLDPYGASDKGVSRRHAVLRPSRNQLYLIDLGSTNGTTCNGIRLANGQAKAIGHNDTISLGKLTFEIKIVDAPSVDRR